MHDDRFQCRAEAAIGKTAGFRSAPAPSEARAQVKILGGAERGFRSVTGTRRVRPALLTEGRCGGFIGRFSCCWRTWAPQGSRARGELPVEPDPCGHRSESRPCIEFLKWLYISVGEIHY